MTAALSSPRQLSPVERATEDLSDRVNSLHATISNLEARLGAVLQPVETAMTKSGLVAASDTPSSPHLSVLEDLVGRIESAGDRIGEVLARLDV